MILVADVGLDLKVLLWPLWAFAMHKPAKLVSRQWSGSSMLDGLSGLTAVKKELPDDPQKLANMIQDFTWVACFASSYVRLPCRR